MRIQSSDGLSFIQIDRRDEDGLAIFNVSADIRGFTGCNRSVLFNGCNEFLRQLHHFDTKREGKVTLEGTEGCQLSIVAVDRAGHLRVDIRLCRYDIHPGGRPTILEGGFAFDAEFANSLFKELRALLRDCG